MKAHIKKIHMNSWCLQYFSPLFLRSSSLCLRKCADVAGPRGPVSQRQGYRLPSNSSILSRGQATSSHSSSLDLGSSAHCSTLHTPSSPPYSWGSQFMKLFSGDAAAVHLQPLCAFCAVRWYAPIKRYSFGKFSWTRAFCSRLSMHASVPPSALQAHSQSSMTVRGFPWH